MKKTILLVFLCLLQVASFSQHHEQHIHKNGSRSASDNLRSDTIDVLNYKITLNITDFTTYTINGNCEVKFTPKMNNISSLSLDLLAMNIDSIKLNSSSLLYNYNDTLLTVVLPAVMNVGDTSTVIVYYNGVPQQDGSWGGFYYQTGYAYNLGVGFDAIPHNFGRVWHPCFDNFAEHASYDFIITSNSGKRAYCNGYLVSEQVNGSDIIRTWRLNEQIPSYLACVAVAGYTHVEQQYVSPVTGDTIPVWLAAVSTDTTNIKNSFINLFDGIQAFEEKYGPYRWNKVGYSFVPFNAGAMEHATNIAYPRSFANGSLTYETIMAHELSHMWWGDHVTCMTAEEMWINEGMAVFSEHIFTEFVYGTTAYFNAVRANHKDVVWRAHINDGGAYAISNVPQNVTYGDHSYKKGADVAHCLRGYLGDSLFFLGLKTIQNNNPFMNITSTDFRDQLNAIPGINVTDFFNDWVLNPGFPQFSIDSITSVPNGGNFDVTVYVKQRLRFAPSYYNNVPLQVVFRDNNGNIDYKKITVSGQTANSTFTVPFNPTYAALNEDEKITDAITADNLTITSTGIKSFNHANFQITVTAITDTAFVRVEHNWVAPDSFTTVNPSIVISPDRYWKVHGIGVNNITGTGRFNLNGVAGGGLDEGLMVDHGSVLFNEDSLVLLYRSSPAQDWSIFPGFVLNTQGNATNKVCSITINSVPEGEYTLGIIVAPLGISNIIENEKIKVFPNPTDGMITIDMRDLKKSAYDVSVYDMSGKLLHQKKSSNDLLQLDLGDQSKGTYIVVVNNKKKIIASERVVVR
ncbi:MAG: M1 family aminopeptidase [Bacteroidota bacterium]